MEIYIKIFVKCRLSAIVIYLGRAFTAYEYLAVVYVCVHSGWDKQQLDCVQPHNVRVTMLTLNVESFDVKWNAFEQLQTLFSDPEITCPWTGECREQVLNTQRQMKELKTPLCQTLRP